MKYELLINDAKMARRGRDHLEAMLEASRGLALASSVYTGKCKYLMLYGAGLQSRMAVMHKHLDAGGRVIVWDLGYWSREDHMRLAIDSLHPTKAQLNLAPPARRFAIKLRNEYDPEGPILLVGLGVKSTSLYGLSYLQWEKRKLAELKIRFPGREIIWRPKGRDRTPLPGTRLSPDIFIDDVLIGCSLVVCRHSNVGVDACRLGIPVETDDGAALALYAGNPNPTLDQRQEFLRQLGWWNWAHAEAGQAWNWIERVVG